MIFHVSERQVKVEFQYVGEKDLLKKLLTVRIPGYQFLPAYKRSKGKWKGEISLYNKTNDSFPIGYLRLIQKQLSLPNTHVFDKRQYIQQDFHIPELKGIELRPYQKQALYYSFIVKNGLIEAATNSGKTLVIVALAKLLYKEHVLILTHSKEIFTQIYEELDNYIDLPIGMITSKKTKIEKYINLAMVSTVANRYNTDDKVRELIDEDCNAVIIDECFTSDTWVMLSDGRRKYISDIVKQVEDGFEVMVKSYNFNERSWEDKKVVRGFRNKPRKEWCKISFKGFTAGAKCTPNHIWYLLDGRKAKAGNLQVGDKVIQLPHGEKNRYQLGYGEVESVNFIQEKFNINTYDLEVEGNHNYLVGSGLLVSNCHHVGSSTYEGLLSNINATYRLGFSGTIPPSDTFEGMQIRKNVGDVILKVGNEDMVEQGVSAKPIVKMIKFQHDIDFDALDDLIEVPEKDKKGRYLNPIEILKAKRKLRYMKAVEIYMVQNERRNQLIADLVSKVNSNMKFLIVVERVEHGIMILDKLLNESVDARFMHGKSKSRTQDLEDFKAGKYRVMLATSLVDEGLNIGGVQGMILVPGKKSRRQVLQRIGRGLRKKTEDNRILVYDFLDIDGANFQKHSLERHKLYIKEKFSTMVCRYSNGKVITYNVEEEKRLLKSLKDKEAGVGC